VSVGAPGGAGLRPQEAAKDEVCRRSGLGSDAWCVVVVVVVWRQPQEGAFVGRAGMLQGEGVKGRLCVQSICMGWVGVW